MENQPSGPSYRANAQFLCQRLREFEGQLSDDEVARQFFGHVSPALARLESELGEAIGRTSYTEPVEAYCAWSEGPWVVVLPILEDNHLAIRTASGADPLDPLDVPYCVACANAHLIAAAPDLYNALEALLPEGWGDDDVMDHMPGVKLARAALAKARGVGR